MFTRALGTTTTGFEGQFRYLADLQGLGTSGGRHPSASLLPVFNASYKALREYVTALGYTQFIKRGTTTTLPTTPVETGETYAVVDVGTSGTPGSPSTMTQIKRVDVKIGGDDWCELPEVTLLQLRDVARRNSGNTTNRPMAWCWLDAGSISTGTTFVKGAIAFAPVPSSGSYCIWAMSDFTDVSATTDVFLYHTEDWAQWHMYHAMLQICGVRDKATAAQQQNIARMLDPNTPGTPAWAIQHQAPTASGPKTWVRSSAYRGW
jgi:hypothetical protein